MTWGFPHCRDDRPPADLSAVRERYLDELSGGQCLRTYVAMVAAQFADDIVAIRDGRVVHHGPVAEVLTADRLEALYDTPAAVEPIAGRQVVLWL